MTHSREDETSCAENLLFAWWRMCAVSRGFISGLKSQTVLKIRLYRKRHLLYILEKNTSRDWGWIFMQCWLLTPGPSWCDRVTRPSLMQHLQRRFDLSRPPSCSSISVPHIHLQPLWVFIHDNLFLQCRHITQVWFPSIQRDSCHCTADGLTTAAEQRDVTEERKTLCRISQMRIRFKKWVKLVFI